MISNRGSLHRGTNQPALSRRSFALVMAVGAAQLITGTLGGCTFGSPVEDEDIAGGAVNQEGFDNVLEASPLAYDSICVSEYLGNTLAVINSDTLEIVERIPAGHNPTMLLRANEKLYVGSSSGGEITVVPLSDTSHARRIPVGYQPLSLCFDEVQQRLFVADYLNNGIHVVDTTLESLVHSMSLSRYGYQKRIDPPACCRRSGSSDSGRRTVSLALSSDGTILYCANFGTYDIARIDLETYTELDPFDGVVAPRTLIMASDGRHLLLAGVGGDVEDKVTSLYVIESDTGKRVLEVPVGVAVSDVCQTKDGKSVLALARDDGALVILNSETWLEKGRVALDIGVDSLALSSDEATVYVSNSSLGVVSVINKASLEVIGSIEGLLNPKDVLAL